MGIAEALLEFGKNELLTVFIVSMLPIVELRGAIPIGVGLGLDPLTVMFVSIIGNCIPVPFIILFIRQIFKFMRKHFSWISNLLDKIENRARGKWEKVHKYQFWGLLIIVAIPLPGTGAWTGALIASLVNMRMKNAIPSIFLGVVVAGIIVTALSHGFSSLFA